MAETIPPINSVTLQSPVSLPGITVVDPSTTPPPAVPGSIPDPASDDNFRLWIYNPLNTAAALGSRGILYQPLGSSSWTFAAANANGSLSMKLAEENYRFDVVEPSSYSGTMSRKRYEVAVSANGSVAVKNVKADGRNFFAVTVSPINPFAAKQMEYQSVLATQKVADYQPTSSCQLLDKLNTTRTVSTLTAGFPRSPFRLPSYGRIKALIVPIDFPDVMGVDNAFAFFKPVAESLRDFYYAESYGRVAFDFDIVSEWVHMPFVAATYRLGPSSTNPDYHGYRRRIIELTQTSINYGKYDAVYFLLPAQTPLQVIGPGPAITSNYLTTTGYFWSGATGGGDMYLTPSGPHAKRNWIAHETGHAFGLYDQDYKHESQTLGKWGVMAHNWSTSAIELGSWDRYLLGWLTDSQIACSTRAQLALNSATVKLDPLVRQNSGAKAAMVPLTDSKILVIESRKNEGMDVLTAAREGVLVYTVDMKLGTLEGGYRIQPRVGSTDKVSFEDAALRSGDSLTVEGIVVTVQSLSGDGDTIQIKALADPAFPVLSIERSGTGRGSIVSSPVGINCTAACAALFAADVTVTLTAQPAVGSEFAGWEGSCSGIGFCRVNLSEQRNVIANFATLTPKSISGISTTAPSDPAGAPKSAFFIGLTLKDSNSLLASARTSDEVELVGYITPDARHAGLQADVYVVVMVGPGVYMRTQDGNFVPWNMQIPTLIPTQRGVMLANNHKVSIFNGKLPVIGDLVVVKLNWPQISGHSNNSVLPSQASYLRYERAA
jgi:M6 family metalloprotease-like protein